MYTLVHFVAIIISCKQGLVHILTKFTLVYLCHCILESLYTSCMVVYILDLYTLVHFVAIIISCKQGLVQILIKFTPPTAAVVSF